MSYMDDTFKIRYNKLVKLCGKSKTNHVLLTRDDVQIEFRTGLESLFISLSSGGAKSSLALTTHTINNETYLSASIDNYKWLRTRIRALFNYSLNKHSEELLVRLYKFQLGGIKLKLHVSLTTPGEMKDLEDEGILKYTVENKRFRKTYYNIHWLKYLPDTNIKQPLSEKKIEPLKVTIQGNSTAEQWLDSMIKLKQEHKEQGEQILELDGLYHESLCEESRLGSRISDLEKCYQESLATTTQLTNEILILEKEIKNLNTENERLLSDNIQMSSSIKEKQRFINKVTSIIA